VPDILLTTLNAKYAHAAFGLRYLLANMGDLTPRTELLEFVANTATDQILEPLLARDLKILGLGVYIWNVDAATRLVRELKRRRPELVIVLGGPEVSYETDEQEIVQAAQEEINIPPGPVTAKKEKRGKTWPHRPSGRINILP